MVAGYRGAAGVKSLDAGLDGTRAMGQSPARAVGERWRHPGIGQAGNSMKGQPAMSRTAAAELAHLKVRFAVWTIRPVRRGEGFTAQQRQRTEKPARPLSIHAITLADLSAKLAEYEKLRRRRKV
jgi:hypothetical protein